MSKSTEFEFQIRAIELIESHVKGGPLHQPKFAFTVNVEHNASLAHKLLIVRVGINVMLDDNHEEIIGNVQVNVGFDLPAIEKYFQNEKLALPNQLVEIFNSIAISTARGVAFSQFRGTSLHQAILPIIDPKTLHKQEI